MRRLAYRLDKFGFFVACASCVFIFLFVLSDVVLRVVGHPLDFSGEYSEFLMAWLIFFALAEVTRDRTHLTVDFLTSRLSPGTQAKLTVFADLFFMAVYVAASLWIAAGLTWNSYFDDLRSQGLMMTPLFIPQLGMIVGLSICFLRTVVDFCVGVNHLIAGTQPSAAQARSYD